jgi:hypothetical protein
VALKDLHSRDTGPSWAPTGDSRFVRLGPVGGPFGAGMGDAGVTMGFLVPVPLPTR